MASSFSYDPVYFSLLPTSPPVMFNSVSGSGVSVIIGLNRTSATVSLGMSNVVQLVANPDFYNNPDYWYCSSGAYLHCYWLSSDSGSSGGVAQIYGSVPLFIGTEAFVWQAVVFPSVTITSITMTVRLRGVSGVMLAQFGLYDPSAGVWVGSDLRVPPSTYTSYSLSINPSSVQAGRIYYVMVGVLAFGGIVDLRYDSVFLNVATSGYVFSGLVLGVNNTDGKSYYARLVLQSASGLSGLSANITLENLSGVVSSPIFISSGSVVSNSTSEVAVPQGVSGYNSLWVRVVSKTSVKGLSVTLSVLFVYCSVSGGGGVCAYYPIVFNLLS